MRQVATFSLHSCQLLSKSLGVEYNAWWELDARRGKKVTGTFCTKHPKGRWAAKGARHLFPWVPKRNSNMAAKRGKDTYPREGERVAPVTLREVLMERVPGEMVVGTRFEGCFLADLDTSVWGELPEKVLVQLAEIVVDRVATGCVRRAFDHRHFPSPPQGMRLSDLRLEHRTRLCLTREGFDRNFSKLGTLAIGEVLAIRAFGPRCLVDLLCGLEAVLSRDRQWQSCLLEEAKLLASLPEARHARREDPRFGLFMQDVDPSSPTAQALGEHLLAGTLEIPDPQFAARRIRELRGKIEVMPTLTLEQELIEIFATTSNERNRQIVIGYYGWEDGRKHTLAEIGARYGMTRERTRQICAKLVKRDDPGSIPAPVMDRALGFLRKRLPRAVDSLEREMVEAGLSEVGLALRNVEAAAKLLDRTIPFHVVRVGKGCLAVAPDQTSLPLAVVELAKKEIYYHGLTTVGHIEETLREKHPGTLPLEIVTETLQLMEGFCWLDRAGGWFRLLSVCKHGLPRAIEKVLSVAGAVDLKELCQAVGRNYRLWKTPPPEKVLLEFCRRMPGVAVEGKRIISETPRDWEKTLTGVEAQLVRLLKEHGPVMDRGALEDLCVDDGMNRFSFHAFVASSPVIKQYGHSVYGLLGADVSPGMVKSLIARRRTQRAPTRVLDSHGVNEDGTVWLSYRLSKAASTYAVITVPAAMKEVVRGRFRLLAPEGREVGILAAKDGRAWGLGAFLRQRGARAEDKVVITLDLEHRTAMIALNTEPESDA